MALEPTRSGPRYALANRHLIEAARQSQDQQRLERLHALSKKPLGKYRPPPQAERFHRSNKRFRFCLGGNRSSKSHSLAVETIWRATGLHPFQPVKVPSVGWYATTTIEKVA